jgi:hypothetical protein
MSFNSRGVILVLVALMVVGTVLDVYDVLSKPNLSIGTKEKIMEKSFAEQLLLTFSMYSNIRRLMRTGGSKGADHLGCLSGMR